MYNSEKIIAIIPARGGSKGIKNKNIYELNGKPLIAYSIEAARKSKYIDYVMVSTDSEAIADVARRFEAKVPFMRPAELASDTAKTIDAIVYCLEQLDEQGEKFDVLVLLQPTSPLRTEKEIDEAIELFFSEGKMGLVSLSEAKENPVLYRKLIDGKAVPILNQQSTVRRQDFDKYYRVNGAIYINSIKDVTSEISFNDNPLGYVMDSINSVDIDSMEDMEAAARILQAR